jgi:membrane complex biogenesis BtpA family protein
MNARIREIFGVGRPLVGVVHLLPLPDSPRFGGSLDPVLERAAADARSLAQGGVSAILVENFGDAPYDKNRVAPVTIAAMTRAVLTVKAGVAEISGGEAARALPLGVNVLRNDAGAALAIAAATGAQFIRVNVHIGVSITDQGTIEGEAARTLRLRAGIAPWVAILADLRVKHASPLAERPVEEEAADLVERGCADAVLLTGGRTGSPPSVGRIEAVRRGAPSTPIWIASGLSEENAAAFREHADGFIVGTHLKEGGVVSAPVDLERVRRLAHRLSG